MFRIFISLLCVSIIAVSCLKGKNDTTCPYSPSTIIAPQAEQDSIAAYLDSNNIEATLHPAGFYYTISNPGSGGESVLLCSQILINYKGQLKNGTVFDQQNNVIFVLGSLIEGWRKGIPLLKKGGQIKLYIPPSLGYGDNDLIDNSSGNVVIPGKSMLIFDVTLLDYSISN